MLLNQSRISDVYYPLTSLYLSNNYLNLDGLPFDRSSFFNRFRYSRLTRVSSFFGGFFVFGSDAPPIFEMLLP
jgi:hypothetical protein